MPTNYKEEAAKLSFDLTKQFITLALGGIAFVVGLSYSSPSAISSGLLWATVVGFGISALLGIVFLMRCISIFSEDEPCDVYSSSIRWFAVLQIIFALLGVGLLGPILYFRPGEKQVTSDAKVIVVKLTEQTLTYPVESDKNYTIEIENGKVKFAASK